MNRTTVQEDRERARRMEELYELDVERHDPSHPHHSTYTGLYQEILIYQKWAARSGFFKV